LISYGINYSLELYLEEIFMKKKEFYTEEMNKPIQDKMKALDRQKYYTGGSIFLMALVLLAMYLVLN